ncbi:MAG: DUF1570 domain-containing protein [Planctomycetales bacterium]
MAKPDSPPKLASPWEAPEESKLAEVGIQAFTSRHLHLFTDLPAEAARTLLHPADQFWEFLEQTLGTEMPSGLSWTKGPVLAYLMEKESTFSKAGLIPENTPRHRAGWHLDQGVWVINPSTDYFRRHLIFHELFHAFCNRRRIRLPPPWLDEGLAEFFATHRLAGNSIQFGVIPRDREELEDWGRIHLIHQEVKKGKIPTIEQIRRWTSKDFQELPTYAWSWGMLCFLDQHPRYHSILWGWLKNWTHSPPRRADFNQLFSPTFEAEWRLFGEELDYGWDGSRAAIDFPENPPPALTDSQQTKILADRGWQLTHWSLSAGKTYHLQATGQATLASTTRPWTSEPDGISFRYYRGRPLGRLLGRLLTRTPEGAWRFGPSFSVGSTLDFKPPEDGVLYLRINDAWGELQDNQGSYNVTCALEASAK